MSRKRTLHRHKQFQSKRSRKSSKLKRPIFELDALEQRLFLSSDTYACYDFEGSSPNVTGWGSPYIVTGGGGSYVRGPCTLTLSSLPVHTGVTVSFRAIALNEWDGNASPSEFTFSANSVKLVDTTFANNWGYLEQWDEPDAAGHLQPHANLLHTSNEQSYPSPYDSSNPTSNPAGTGAVGGPDWDDDGLDVTGYLTTSEWLDPDNGADSCGHAIQTGIGTI
jgi:hypothetical protein